MWLLETLFLINVYYYPEILYNRHVLALFKTENIKLKIIMFHYMNSTFRLPDLLDICHWIFTTTTEVS